MDEKTRVTEEILSAKCRWQRGQSGKPSGRPMQSRQRLGEKFIAVLAADFELHGK